MSEENIFDRIVIASHQNKISDMNKAVMEYLLFFLTEEDQGSKTCREIVSLDLKLRERKCPVRFVARTAKPPELCSRTHRNEPMDYYLQLTNTEKEFSLLLEEEGVSEEENQLRLEKTGLCVRDLHEERKSAEHLQLPKDLDQTRYKEIYFDRESISLFVPKVTLSLLEKHAQLISKGILGDDLCGSMVESMRMAIPLDKWSDTKDSLLKTMSKKLPFAQQQTAISTIRQDLIPLGFHSIGITKDRTFIDGKKETEEEFVLVDLYSWQVRRFYITLEKSIVDQLDSNDGKVDSFLEELAIAAGVANCELENIKDMDDIKRYFVISSS